MTREQVKENLLSGKTLEDMFDFTDGQECLIYKADKFTDTDDVIYIPDIYLNEIPTEKDLSGLDDEELDEILSQFYTGKDFMEETHGNYKVAEALFEFVDWQHPVVADMIETFDNDNKEFMELYGANIDEFN